MKHLFVAVCAVCALAAGAVAQSTTAPSQPSTTPPAAQRTQPSQAQQPGITAVNPGAVTVTFYTVAPADVLTSNLEGVDVYNNENENVGEIVDFVIDNGKQLRAVVLSVGGFLGIGDRRVAVEPKSLTITRQDGSAWRATLNTNKEDLGKAPEVKVNPTRK